MPMSEYTLALRAKVGHMLLQVPTAAVVVRDAHDRAWLVDQVERDRDPGSWSGRRESNPRMQLGKLPFYH